jgi:hypothetical protein
LELPEVSAEPFNMAQWAKDHDRRDDERFGRINAIMGAAGFALLAVTGWSLVAQYTSMQKQVDQAQVQMAAIQQVRTDVGAPRRWPTNRRFPNAKIGARLASAS